MVVPLQGAGVDTARGEQLGEGLADGVAAEAAEVGDRRAQTRQAAGHVGGSAAETVAPARGAEAIH